MQCFKSCRGNAEGAKQTLKMSLIDFLLNFPSGETLPKLNCTLYNNDNLSRVMDGGFGGFSNEPVKH